MTWVETRRARASAVRRCSGSAASDFTRTLKTTKRVTKHKTSQVTKRVKSRASPPRDRYAPPLPVGRRLIPTCQVGRCRPPLRARCARWPWRTAWRGTTACLCPDRSRRIPPKSPARGRPRQLCVTPPSSPPRSSPPTTSPAWRLPWRWRRSPSTDGSRRLRRRRRLVLPPPPALIFLEGGIGSCASRARGAPAW